MFGLIVYGSLLHKDEINKYDSMIEDIIPVKVLDYKRSFNLLPAVRIGVGNYKSVLNIEESKNDSFNGVCIIYKEIDIALIDDRERGYDRIMLDSNNIQTYNNDILLDSMNVYVYRGFKHMIDYSIMPNVDYLKLCLEGSQQWGKEFHQDFIETTYMNNNNTLYDFIDSDFTL